MSRTVYIDKNGRTFSAPLELHGDQWLMRTSEGLQKVEYAFHDDVGGRLTFDSFREDQPTVPTTQKPDTLHVEGQGFKALQEAGARAAAHYRTERAQQRREILNSLNQPIDANRIHEARGHSTALAQRWSHARPEPTQPPLPPKHEMAEDHRLKKKKEEQSQQ
ncbi:MAG TPA: hypothetical protein VGR55_00445 [Candidatus Acidoferrum sp.]|nr:hypothetical protein [Candidatus Acidoferrum sp.]